MNAQKMYDLKELLCRELENISGKGELSAGDLETANKLTGTITNICKIIEKEEGGYSGDGEWSADMRGSYGNGYGRSYGRSYGRRRRDSMGRYSGRRYSRDGIMDKLSELMDEAGTDWERDTIQRCIESMS